MLLPPCNCILFPRSSIRLQCIFRDFPNTSAIGGGLGSSLYLTSTLPSFVVLHTEGSLQGIISDYLCILALFDISACNASSWRQCASAFSFSCGTCTSEVPALHYLAPSLSTDGTATHANFELVHRFRSKLMLEAPTPWVRV